MELLKKLSYIKSYNNIHDIYKTRDARVICFYLNLQSMNGKDFEISLKNICKGLKMCKQTVINSNNYLLENGLIDIKNDGEPTSINTYTVNVEKVLSFVPIKKERKKRVVVDGPKKEFLEATEQQDDTNEVILSEEPSEPSEEAKKEILSPQLQKLMEENKNRVKDEDEDIENIEVVEEKEEDKTKNNILSNNLKKIIGNLKVVDDEQPTTCEVLSIENTHPVEQPDSKEIEIIPTKEESNEVVEVYQDDEKENNEVIEQHQDDEVIEQHQDDEKEKGYNNIVEKDGVVVVQSRHIDISEEKPRARKATKYTNEKIDWSICGDDELIELIKKHNSIKPSRAKFKYQDQLEFYLDDLKKLSNGSLSDAKLIVKQSYKSGWQGIFELKKCRKDAIDKTKDVVTKMLMEEEAKEKGGYYAQ